MELNQQNSEVQPEGFDQLTSDFLDLLASGGLIDIAGFKAPTRVDLTTFSPACYFINLKGRIMTSNNLPASFSKFHVKHGQTRLLESGNTVSTEMETVFTFDTLDQALERMYSLVICVLAEDGYGQAPKICHQEPGMRVIDLGRGNLDVFRVVADGYEW